MDSSRRYKIYEHENLPASPADCLEVDSALGVTESRNDSMGGNYDNIEKQSYIMHHVVEAEESRTKIRKIHGV